MKTKARGFFFHLRCDISLHESQLQQILWEYSTVRILSHNSKSFWMQRRNTLYLHFNCAEEISGKYKEAKLTAPFITFLIVRKLKLTNFPDTDDNSSLSGLRCMIYHLILGALFAFIAHFPWESCRCWASGSTFLLSLLTLLACVDCWWSLCLAGLEGAEFQWIAKLQ